MFIKYWFREKHTATTEMGQQQRTSIFYCQICQKPKKLQHHKCDAFLVKTVLDKTTMRATKYGGELLIFLIFTHSCFAHEAVMHRLGLQVKQKLDLTEFFCSGREDILQTHMSLLTEEDGYLYNLQRRTSVSLLWKRRLRLIRAADCAGSAV